MKTIKIQVIQLNDRGDILLNETDGNYTVKNSDGVHTYVLEEMAEIYDLDALSHQMEINRLSGEMEYFQGLSYSIQSTPEQKARARDKVNEISHQIREHLKTL